MDNSKMKIFSLLDELKKTIAIIPLFEKTERYYSIPEKSPKHNIYCISLLQAN